MLDSHIYVIGDGDKVRDRLDALLFAGQMESLKQLSTSISEAVFAFARDAVASMGGDIVVAGGDDILLRVPPGTFDSDVLESLRRAFEQQTGGSFSIGAAPEIETAYLNLRRAKARGGNAMIVSR
jgi:hypothetical protein